MTKIVDYKVICRGHYDDLGRDVKTCLDDGWQPHGSMVLVQEFGHPSVLLMQPMVRYAHTHIESLLADFEDASDIATLLREIDSSPDLDKLIEGF